MLFLQAIGMWPPQTVVSDIARKRVTLASRELKKAQARTILNEQEIIEYITSRRGFSSGTVLLRWLVQT